MPAPIERLETARLTLRRPEFGDIDAIFAIHRDPRTLAHNPGDALGSREAAVERFHAWDAHWNAHGYGYFTVVGRDSDAILGFCGVKRVTFRGKPALNLFYRFDPRQWGQRYASEAAASVVEHVARSLPPLPLIAKVRPDNIASHRIVARLGFVECPEHGEVGEDGFEHVYLYPDRERG